MIFRALPYALIQRLLCPVLALVMSASAAQATTAPDQSAFHGLVMDTYYITSADLSGKQRDEHVARLDQFWNHVRSAPQQMLPLLRQELRRSDVPGFFLFDGSELLLTLSQSDTDMALGLSALARAKPEKIAPGGYLVALSRYNARGLDTRPMAWRWLTWDEPVVTVATQSRLFQLTPLEALVFSAFGMDEAVLAADLAKRLAAARHDRQITLLIEALWTTATPQGHAALAAYAADTSRKTKARAFARTMLSHGAPGVAVPDEAAVAALRAERRTILQMPWRYGTFARYHEVTDRLVTAAGLKAP